MSVTGEWIDAGDYAGLLEALENRADYAGKRAVQANRRAAGEVVGLGLSLYIEPCGQGWETARIELSPQGRFLAQTGSSAQGQGRQTAWAQIVADALGVAPDCVDVAAGDTADLENGIGALASRSTAIGGSAMRLAAEALRGRIAAALGVNDLVTDAGGVILADSCLSWSEVAARMPRDARIVNERFAAPHEAWASGAALAQVAIDRETGRVTVEEIVWIDDAGEVVNPLLVQGQLWGGLAQGLGCVLSERVAYDADGQLLTGSLMDYAVPRATDMPCAVTLDKRPTPSAANPLGAKGVGEAGCIAIPPAVLNALQDAILPYSTADLPLPATPETLWRAINFPQEDA
jgi:carbon-monoxide dehydrogenase large subunit